MVKKQSLNCIFEEDKSFNMRYIGNKESVIPNIIQILKENGLLEKRFTFFDAFCGMGAVSNALKDYYNLKINDILKCCITFCSARVLASEISFDNMPL